ncbi:TrgA family protein [Maribius pontilimi]|uniref:TrgA family protein n=1 Tax=Palleronia pontilimi TaxID=1964209 RepID=A0A934IIJ3_9RHOB|nr:TrgA family protein [Palleronia pontilimi]MBJ3764005.1 TrgA family protein [Palleronia pontilimi]
MYPTAAKLIASLSFAALAWYASQLVVPNLPEGMSEGIMPEINALVGLVLGWRITGRRAGDGFVNAIGIGLTTGAAIVLCSLLIWAGHEMLQRSINVRYDGPIEGIEDMIVLFLRYATFMYPGPCLSTLAIGSILAGLLAEATAKRYGK